MKHLGVIFLVSMILVGCNTVSGVGKDVERAGEAVQDAAKKK
jgi:predicted small secreted protein